MPVYENLGLDLPAIHTSLTPHSPPKVTFWTDRAGTFSLAIGSSGEHPATSDETPELDAFVATLKVSLSKTSRFLSRNRDISALQTPPCAFLSPAVSNRRNLNKKR